MELLVLMIAEVVALRYYRALRDGTDDSLTADVAGRILSDEQRHVPFHCERLHASLAELPHAMRRPVMVLWAPEGRRRMGAVAVAAVSPCCTRHYGVPSTNPDKGDSGIT
jgi:hypothetical protein